MSGRAKTPADSPHDWREASARIRRRQKRCGCDPLDIRWEGDVLECGECGAKMIPAEEAFKAAAE